MDMVKKIFPFSFKSKEVKDLVINIVIYLVASIVGGWLLGLLGGIPLLGVIFDLIGSLFGLYCLVGIVLAVLDFLKILK
ncbi:MAG: hypothetical protein IKM26_01305 [Clostridia bacterium]|nr:hypothetical protein [Clostridia bacterium]